MLILHVGLYYGTADITTIRGGKMFRPIGNRGDILA